ncbi:hypothetical protein NW762_012875 [Fusarium torreyae]|uniref:Nephrocystin 3-like N-terminal domain-containing protein n=1 Tax=Fusarium torreyae TaxID=1237075 RepID=A0A9W8RPL7_9HYPO|nr:hypothetical protein NW762_012875 [Fusarium torreyae]
MRKKLAEEKDVLCFEMEAAGLMNHFPCLVIRGICDYSDSHKDDQWQGYAAMAAAAFAKDLLNRIVPKRIENETRMAELFLKGLNDIENIERDIKEIQDYSQKLGEIEILNWLVPSDYGLQQSEIFQKRQPGTGQWILDSEAYQTWTSTQGGTLFCSGIPGAGKTIITSIVVNDLMQKQLEDPHTGLAYLYCDYQRKSEQTLEHFVASLLKQLAAGLPLFPDALRQLRLEYKNKSNRPSLHECQRTLQTIAKDFKRIFIVIDALDECLNDNYCLPRLLSDIFDLQRSCGVNIFATSRPLTHIVNKFQNVQFLEIRAREDDIRAYLTNRMPEFADFVQKSPHLQELIKDGICRAVSGMFLLVGFHLDSLAAKLTLKALMIAIEQLRTGSHACDSVYHDAMQRVDGQAKDKRELARKTLMWLSCAKRRLTLPMLLEILAVEVDSSRLDPANRHDVADVVSVCAGLITVTKEVSTDYLSQKEECFYVQLAHYTTTDFFERTRQVWFPDADSQMTRLCLTYLLFDDFQKDFPPQMAESRTLALNNTFPFYKYAAETWGKHCLDGSVQLHDIVFRFLESGDPLLASWDIQERPWSPEKSDGRVLTSALHTAIRFGLEETALVLIQRGHNTNLLDRSHRTPLIWAACKGQIKITQSLLTHPDVRRDIDIKPGVSNMSALWEAARFGNANIVKLLLDNGADGNSTGYFAYAGLATPLMVAAAGGHELAVATLLSHHLVDQLKEDSEGHNALWYAANFGKDSIVRVLLAQGGPQPQTETCPLWAAAMNDRFSTVELLLKSGFDPYQGDGLDYHSPYAKMDTLSAVSYCGSVEMAELLIRHGVNVNKLGLDGQTPLFKAVRNGEIPMIKLLLDKGADPNAQDAEAETPLFTAVDCEELSIARETITLLINKGANLNAQNQHYETPFLKAIKRGHKDLVISLVRDFHVDLSYINSKGLTALSYAAVWCDETLLEFLLTDHRAKLDVQDSWGATPWFWAKLNGKEKIAEMLSNQAPESRVSVELDLLIQSFRTDPFVRETLMPHASSVFSLFIGSGQCAEKVDPEALKGIFSIYRLT